MVDWAAQEGWNPGLDDAENYYAADPNGFLIGWVDDKPVSSISAVKYGDEFSFIGFYIVHPDYRSRGLGLQIWKAAIDYIGKQPCGLDGVVDQQENYRKSGFELAFENVRYEGTGFSYKRSLDGFVDLKTFYLSKLLEYDRAFFPTARPEFLSKWIHSRNATAIGYTADEGESLSGYTVVRRCREGYKIGPLNADSPDIAHALFGEAISTVPTGEKVFLDIPGNNPEAKDLVEQNQMQPMFETARMYKNGNPKLPAQRIYGITSFEIG